MIVPQTSIDSNGQWASLTGERVKLHPEPSSRNGRGVFVCRQYHKSMQSNNIDLQQIFVLKLKISYLTSCHVGRIANHRWGGSIVVLYRTNRRDFQSAPPDRYIIYKCNGSDYDTIRSYDIRSNGAEVKTTSGRILRNVSLTDPL